MDYEKLYKEALSRAKSTINKCGDNKGRITIIESIFPELAESDDELMWLKKFIKEEIDCLSIDIRDYDDHIKLKNLQRSLVWLEKQGDSSIKWNKNTEDNKPQVNHSVLMQTTHGIAEGEWQGEQWHQYRWTSIVRDTDVLSWMELSNLEKQGEQKPSDKVKPKFHEGDWITDGDYTWKIVEVEPLDYILQSQDGNIVDDTISYVDEQFHSFTIEDAKDGDVLVYEEEIFMIKSYALWNEIVYHCCYDGKNLHFDSVYNSWMKEDFDKVHPATKEQRAFLFEKMKKAGYTWDDEKKELKKINN